MPVVKDLLIPGPKHKENASEGVVNIIHRLHKGASDAMRAGWVHLRVDVEGQVHQHMEILRDLSVTIVGLFVVGCYTWSLRGHFSSPRMPDGAKIISAVVVATALLFLWLTWSRMQVPWVQMVGLAMQLASLALFWWAIMASRRAKLRFAFDPEGPRGLVTDGPYRHLRHPFYTSYLLFWSGWGLSTGSWWALIPVVAFIVIYAMAARDEERKFANSDMAETYERYKATAGFLLPRLR